MSTNTIFWMMFCVAIGAAVIEWETRTEGFSKRAALLLWLAAAVEIAQLSLKFFASYELPVVPIALAFGLLLPLVGLKALKVSKLYNNDAVHDFGAGVNFLAFLMIVVPPMWAAA